MATATLRAARAGEEGESVTAKVTVNLPDALARELRALADREGKTFTQVLKEAMALKLYIDNARDSGATVLLEAPGKPLRELVFQS